LCADDKARDLLLESAMEDYSMYNGMKISVCLNRNTTKPHHFVEFQELPKNIQDLVVQGELWRLYYKNDVIYAETYEGECFNLLVS